MSETAVEPTAAPDVPSHPQGDHPFIWAWVGAVVAVTIAAFLFTRYSFAGLFSRDEGIYVYGGQQLAHHGVAPYASIVDPKGPLADFLCALGVSLAGPFGLHDLTAVRLLFFVLSLATVAGVYLLARRLFGSVLLGVAAAVIMASFPGFAGDAVAGPDAKTPGLLCLVLAMWLALDRRWFLVGLLSGLCFLDWQPFFTYAMAFAVCAWLLPTGDGRRLHWRPLGRVAAGLVAPLLATAVYFLADGTWGDMWQSAFVFPLTGIQRGRETFVQHLQDMRAVIDSAYHDSAALLYVGLLLLVVAVVAAFLRAPRGPSARSRVLAWLADPLVCIVFLSGLLQVLYMLYDFQGYPDVYPALPYAAIGITAIGALARQALADPRLRLAAGGIAAVLTVVLAGAAWSWFRNDPNNDTRLQAELADACAVHLAAMGQGGVWSLGFPPALVLTGQTNPDPYIYLDSGVQNWKVAHTPGGLDGWAQQIIARHPGVIVVQGWHGSYHDPLIARLVAAGYHRTNFGKWRVLMTPAARAQVVARGVTPQAVQTHFAVDSRGRMLPGYPCLGRGK